MFSIRSLLRRLKFPLPDWTIPILLLLVSSMSILFMINNLGFYLDDWTVIAAHRYEGYQGVQDFFLKDSRPLAAWTYAVTSPILGSRPLNWHIFFLIIRWLTTVSMWLVFRSIWPKHPGRTIWMALLFAVYPVFSQQPTAVAYSQHWITYFLYSVSLFFMVSSIRRPRWYLPLTALALLTQAFHLFTMEFFIGIEFLRPFILWFLDPPSARPAATKVVKTFTRWAPYLAVVGLYSVWRLFLMPGIELDRNRPELLENLSNSPLSTLVNLVITVMQDTVQVMVSTWYKTLEPGLFDIRTPANVLAWFLAVITAILIGAFFYINTRARSNEPDGETSFFSSGFVFGAVAVLLGPVPAWMIGRQIADPSSVYNDRFALASMVGASVLLVVIIERLISQSKARLILLTALVALAVGANFRAYNEYRWSWTYQQRFYWQLFWRAPHIQPQTALVSDHESFKFMGKWPTSLAINLLYPQTVPVSDLGYWFFLLPREFDGRMPDYLSGADLLGGHVTFSFRGTSYDSLPFYYNQEQNYCVWLLDAEDSTNPILPPILSQSLPVADLSLISDPPSPVPPPEDIFGPEPEHTWCYYYQNAELARQKEDWPQVIRYWEEAESLGYKTNTGVELVPFIEAYAHEGNWETARSLVLTAVDYTPELETHLCTVWDRVKKQVPPSEENDGYYSGIWNDLNCAAAISPEAISGQTSD